MDKIVNLNENYKFYMVFSGSTTYILTLLEIYESEYNKIKFSLYGTVLSNITDTLLAGNTVLRRDGNISYHIKDATH